MSIDEFREQIEAEGRSAELPGDDQRPPLLLILRHRLSIEARTLLVESFRSARDRSALAIDSSEVEAIYQCQDGQWSPIYPIPAPLLCLPSDRIASITFRDPGDVIEKAPSMPQDRSVRPDDPRLAWGAHTLLGKPQDHSAGG